MRCSNKQGLTLVEVLITVFVLAIGILSSLLFFTNAMISTEYARDLTVATTHVEYVLEEIQTRSTLANINGTNWASWFTTQGLNTLPSETVAVTYANAASDPLEVTATITWTKKNKTSNVALTTKFTK